MDVLRQSDLRRLLACVRACHATREFESFEEFLKRLVATLSRLIPAAHVTYNEMYPEKPESYNIASSTELNTLTAATLWRQHMNEHPVLAHVAQTGDHHTMRISDFWNQRQLRDSGLYAGFYRGYDIEDALCATLSTRLPRIIGYGWHRDRRFTEREQLLADLIRPHVIQAVKNARTSAEVRSELQLLKDGMESAALAVIVCDKRGVVKSITALARRYLTEYLGVSQNLDRQLPETLLGWQRSRQARLRDRDISSVPQPLVLSRGEDRLRVRLLSNAENNLLLLEEMHSAPDAVNHDGACMAKRDETCLSRRELEALAWVAQGKTNSELAAILGISLSTAKKHVEHILDKLGVETRTAAAAIALRTPSRLV
jgi:DNA-binding CsgD family transcriptional regulator